MDAATLYTLIVVTYAGNVSVTPNIQSRPLCEDARQIAQTGLTVWEEKVASDARDRAARERAAECSAKPSNVLCSMFMTGGGGPDSVKFARCVIDPAK